MSRPPTNALMLGYLLQPRCADVKEAPPAGYVPVPVGKDCVLMMTREEYVNGVKRDKVWRRSATRHKRQRGCGDA